jgi:hypothetical protein
VSAAPQLAFDFSAPAPAPAPVPDVAAAPSSRAPEARPARRPSAADAEGLLLRLQALGLRRAQRLVLTRNRTVMVSWRDDVLRVHVGYLGAPDPVLAGIVRFLEGGTRAERSAGRRALLGFAIPDDAPRRRRRDPLHPDDAPLAARLAAWHARLNAERFAGTLRPVALKVSRRMKTRLGHYAAATPAGDPPEIVISRRHLRRHGWKAALETLLHEMVHQWQDESGLPLDHGPAFRRMARAVGAIPRARARPDGSTIGLPSLRHDP